MNKNEEKEICINFYERTKRHYDDDLQVRSVHYDGEISA